MITRLSVSRGRFAYVFDVGVRNAISTDFNTLEIRDDAGNLWENHMIVERLKMRIYFKTVCQPVFLPHLEQHEIDLI